MITAAALPVVSVTMFILDPPSLEDIKWDASGTGNIRPLLCGQIGLIATWAAIAAFHTIADHLTFNLTVRASTRNSWNEFVGFCYLVLRSVGPVVCVLLLVRVAGYRLAGPRAP